MRTFSSLVDVSLHILFFTFWTSNMSCTNCRNYTMVYGRPNRGKFLNCLAALCPLNDKLLACIADWNILNWTNGWYSPQLELAVKLEWNRRCFLLPWFLFFLKTCFYMVYFKFSRILTSLFCLFLSLIDFCFQFICGFCSALHLTYSFHIRQIFFFVFFSLQSLL